MRHILLTILIVLAVVFTMQNMYPIELVFVVWSIKTVAALAIILALVLGMLIGSLFVLPAVMRNKRAVKQSKKKVVELEGMLKEQSTAASVDTRSEMPKS
jgi:uncharacterized integral membrane protein